MRRWNARSKSPPFLAHIGETHLDLVLALGDLPAAWLEVIETGSHEQPPFRQRTPRPRANGKCPVGREV
jgi:hypothetical protein